jgi:predicted amidohydrolase
MPRLSRRDFLISSSALALTATAPARGAMGPNDKFDLVIKGGDVLDPSQSLRGKRDIGIRFGKIETVDADIPAARALRVLNADGKLVTPGLVDLHCHVYPYGSALSSIISISRRPMPRRKPSPRIPTLCSARRYACRTTSLPSTGSNRSNARLACEQAGDGMKVMCHIGGVETRQLMSQILDLLRPGDILTHCYSGFPNLAGDFTNIVQDGKLLPAALAAKQRGVIFDVGHGGGSFDYTVAEAAIAQGTPPDTISSDIHAVSGNTPGMPYLTWVMSKFMGLGFTLEQVVAMATINPAKVINRAPKIGTLQMGAPGDVAIMELVEGPVSFVDTRNNKRDGKVYLLLMTRRRPRGVSDGFQRTAITGECPLWVKSRHFALQSPCPLYLQVRHS